MEYTLTLIRPAKTRGALTLCLRAQADAPPLTLTVRRTFYESIGAPLAGAPIGQDTFIALRAEDEVLRVLPAAVRLLAYGDNSERQLYQKLVCRGFSPACASEAVREVVRRGYLCEERQLRLLIEELANRRLYGRERILAGVRAKGYPLPLATHMLDQMCRDGTVNFEKNFAVLVQKKRVDPTDDSQKRKLQYTYGYHL